MTVTDTENPPGAGWGGALDFELPAELIAQEPAARREGSRLMVVDRATATIEHAAFSDLCSWLGGESLLVANDSRVFAGRLKGRKDSGGRIEFLVLSLDERDGVPVMFKAGKPPQDGCEVRFSSEVNAVVRGPVRQGRCRLDFGSRKLREVLDELGEIPLPPYIRRPKGATEQDRQRYQTVYAKQEGSVAAPTAGLHFSAALMESLRARGAEFRTLTLHVGPGTFVPVRNGIDDHIMEAESFSVPIETAQAVAAARRQGRRVVAVGTTTVRAMESAVKEDGGLRSGPGLASLFIRPGYRFRMVDALLTNFHLPGSTLLALVMAFAGEDLLRAAYDAAVDRRYRFYSYGDAMLLL